MLLSDKETGRHAGGEPEPSYLVQPSGAACSSVREDLVPAVLEVWEFANFFNAQILGSNKLSWVEFETALVDPGCALFHGLHVVLVRILFGGEEEQAVC